jgi:hypothetical protein
VVAEFNLLVRPSSFFLPLLYLPQIHIRFPAVHYYPFPTSFQLPFRPSSTHSIPAEYLSLKSCVNNLRPGFLNSLAGAISTLVNVYAQQDGTWSLTAKITIIVVGSIGIINGGLFVLYEYWMLERVRSTHEQEMLQGGAEKEGGGEGGDDGEHGGHGKGHEGLVDKIERIAHEPGMEPGSVV